MTLMPSNDPLEKLASADAHLDCAIRSLLEMDSPAETCPLELQRAATLLSSAHLRHDAITSRAPIELLLHSIAAKAATARRLLDGAATFYFGAVLNPGSLEQGYSVTGVPDRFGGGCLRVEG